MEKMAFPVSALYFAGDHFDFLLHARRLKQTDRADGGRLLLGNFGKDIPLQMQ